MEKVECRGRRVKFTSEPVKLPNGTVIRVDRVVFPDSVAVTPLYTGNCSIVLIEQYRPAVDDWVLEIPAGVIDPGEDAEEAARRELKEETGLRTSSLVKVASGYVSPGYSTEKMTLFLALDPEEGEPRREEHEVIKKTLKIRVDEALEMITTGKIRDIKTILGIYAAKYYCMHQ
ncbi:MAG: NUDIX hydrolase [Desulfurococcales archaeon]|nr:NUDIX hydrolase [Desulfurococcales archaeon]